MKRSRHIISSILALLLTLCIIPSLSSYAERNILEIKPNTTESDVSADILLPDGIEGEYYRQEATTTQVITGFVSPDDENYYLYMVMANSAVIKNVSLVKGNVPEGLSISNTAQSAKFEGTPKARGSYTFYVDITVQASLFGQVTTKILRAKVMIDILPPKPIKPVFTASPSDSYEIEMGNALNISVAINCPEKCDLILYIKQGTSFSRLTSKSSADEWSFDPLSIAEKASSPGEYTFKIEAVNTQDKTLKESCIFTVEVYEKQTAPENAKITGNSSCNAGETISFSCSATGKNLEYKWYTKASGSSSFSAVADGNTYSFTTSTFDDGMQIKCVVSNSAGSTSSDIITLTVIKPHTHSFGAWKVARNATCTVDGIERSECECGAFQTKIIAATGHSFESDWTIEYEPDCLNEGSKYHKCSKCGERSDETIIPPNGHSLNNWVTTVSPTYEKEGTEKRTCKNCDYSETRSIPKLVHSHEHSFIQWSTVIEPSCLTSGMKKSVCECGEELSEEIPPNGHSYSQDFVVLKNPSCTESGSKAIVCSVCNDKKSETPIAPTGHQMGKWVVTKPATTEEDGEQTRYCEKCDYKETQTIAKLITGHEHSFGSWYKSKPASCTEPGEETRSCSCGLKETRATPPSGHSFGNWTLETPPECEKAGVEKRICSCGEAQTRTVAQTGHSFGSWTILSQPTDEKPGLMSRECSKCQKAEYKEIQASDITPVQTPDTTPTDIPHPGVTTQPPTSTLPETQEAPNGKETQSPAQTLPSESPSSTLPEDSNSSVGIIILVSAISVTAILGALCIGIKIGKTKSSKQ